MVCRIAFLFVLLFAGAGAHAGDASDVDGLIVESSPHDVATTVERFQRVARANGLTVFDTVDHAEGATQAGMDLAPTTLVIFGNPKAGTPLMQCGRTMGIDLPAKALIWDDDGETRLAYNDIEYLAERHDIGDCKAVPKVGAMLDKLATKTVSEDALDGGD